MSSDAVIIGAPVENSNTHHLVQQWINEQWIFSSSNARYDLSSKIGAAFVTAGGISAGEEGTMLHLLQSMMIFRMIVVGGNDWTSSFGASAITHEEPFGVFDPSRQEDSFFPSECYDDDRRSGLIHPKFLARAYGLGIRVATVTQNFKYGTNNSCPGSS